MAKSKTLAVKEIVVDGIPISVTRKKIKNMYIRIVPPEGEVRLSAPYSVSDDVICSFVVSRLPWIRKHKKEFAERMHQPERQYQTGENYYVWGKRYVLEVRQIESSGRTYLGESQRLKTARDSEEYGCMETRGYPTDSVHLAGEKLVLSIREGSTPGQREAVLNEWLRGQIKAVIPELLERCENVVGVQAQEWRVKNMRTRWGTCNVQKKRIWLNLQLAKKAPECLEYVIIHELVHLLERNHNTKFYRYLNTFYPDWRAVKDKLNHEQR